MDTPVAVCNGATLRTARWTDPSDLAIVRDAFYPDTSKAKKTTRPFDPYAPAVAVATQPTQTESNAKRRAIERVSLYARHDRIPHALQATATLIDAQLHYSHYEDYNAGRHATFRISTAAMRSIFAMAFCRFVNGFVDRDIARSAKAMRNTGLASARSRNVSSENESESESGHDPFDIKAPKGVGELSMYKHAQAIGMPASFVDLRHKATHGKEPSLKELAKATQDALAWLWEKWWKLHAKGDATLRLWEVEKWDEALAALRSERLQIQDQDQDQDQVDDTELESGSRHTVRWETVTENGVTKFVAVK